MKELFETTAIATIITCAVAWLIRNLAMHFLSRDIESYKLKLKCESDKEIERLKASLHIAAEEHRIIFSQLHGKRALIIAELYSLLTDLLVSAELFGGRMVFDTIKRIKPFADDAHQKAVKLACHFNRNKIFFSKALCAAMNDLTWLIADTTLQASSVTDIPEGRMEFEKEFSQNLNNSINTMNRCQHIIEDEFKNLLGMTSSS